VIHSPTSVAPATIVASVAAREPAPATARLPAAAKNEPVSPTTRSVLSRVRAAACSRPAAVRPEPVISATILQTSRAASTIGHIPCSGTGFRQRVVDFVAARDAVAFMIVREQTHHDAGVQNPALRTVLAGECFLDRMQHASSAKSSTVINSAPSSCPSSVMHELNRS